MKSFYKKIISVLLISILMFSFSSVCFAKSGAEVYAEPVTANAGDEITIPIMIKNNPGLMGYKLIFEYDQTVFTAVKVTRGTALKSGMFENSLSDKTTNSFFVIWSDVENKSDNGELFAITFKTSASAKGVQSIKISYSKDDTFNESWKPVELHCGSAKVDFGKDAEPETPDEPEPQPSFFRKVLNFFVKIWNFIKGLFK